MRRATVAEWSQHDQAIGEDLMQASPRMGPALCSVRGVYRGYRLAGGQPLPAVREAAVAIREEQP